MKNAGGNSTVYVKINIDGDEINFIEAILRSVLYIILENNHRQTVNNGVEGMRSCKMQL